MQENTIAVRKTDVSNTAVALFREGKEAGNKFGSKFLGRLRAEKRGFGDSCTLGISVCEICRNARGLEMSPRVVARFTVLTLICSQTIICKKLLRNGGYVCYVHVMFDTGLTRG